MKRIGLLILLSASYAGLLTFVFSTDYSREHSFLLPESTPPMTGKHFEAPVMGEFADLTDRYPSGESMAKQTAQAETVAGADEQSPESAQ